jgi:hypothetical protein
VTVPRYLFEWVHDSRNGEWTVADTGMLVVMLQQFENRTPLIAGATFEEEDGEPVLVIPGAIGGDIRFQGRANGDSLDSTDSGHVRVKVALAACLQNKWLTAEQTGGKLRIKLGERAKRVERGPLRLRELGFTTGEGSARAPSGHSPLVQRCRSSSREA